MGTLTGLMNLSKSALTADQTAINTTSQNVANQTTTGYTREVTTFASVDNVTLNGESYAISATAGSQRDLVLEQSLHLATQSASAATSRLGALQSMESLFGLTSTSSNASSTTLGSALDGMSSALTALSANPTDTPTRNAVVSATQALAAAFNSTAAGLQQQTASLNGEISTAAGQVNALTSTVASLNQQITALGSGTDAGQLEDQRQQAIEQLSAIVGVNQITSDGNGVTLTTSTGAVLVEGSESYSLSTTTVDGNTQIVAGDPPATQADIIGGSIGGLLQARDQDIPAVSNALDRLAYAVGTSYNTVNEAGNTPYGAHGQAMFTLSSSVSGAAWSISAAMTSGIDVATASFPSGSGDTNHAAALSASGSAVVLDGQTASQVFSSLLGSIGTTVAAASTASTVATAAQTQAQTTRNSLSGVSLDDEASALMTYQRAYQAAAKVMTVVDQMMESAINLGTATSV